MGKKSHPIDIDAIAARVAATVVAQRRPTYSRPAITGPITSHRAVEAVARVSGVRVAMEVAMRQYDGTLPPNLIRAVRAEDPADSAWVAKQIEKRRSYRAMLARKLGISSATAAAFDRGGDVIHIVDR